MKQMEQLTAKLQELREKTRPWTQKAGKGYRKAKTIGKKAWPWIWQGRKILLAVPVVQLMLYFARLNWNVLPEQVGLNLQSSGEVAMMVTRNYAVFGPLCVTGFCLLLMFCSRKTVFPWIISFFTLVLPYLIYLTNIYMA